MKTRSLLILPKVICFIGSSLILTFPVQAITWEGGNSADWADGLNWTGGTAPDEFTSAEFSAAVDGGGLATPSGLVMLEDEQRAGSLIVIADVLTLVAAMGPSVLDLRYFGEDPPSSTLEVSGGALDLASPSGPVPGVSSSLTLANNITVKTDSGFIGANNGDDAAILLAGGRLEVSTGSTIEVGNSDGSGIGRIGFVAGGYGSFVADNATVVIHDGSSFDTNGTNAFASIGTLDLRAGSTTHLGSYFQLWTNNLQIEDGADFTWQTTNPYDWSQLWIRQGGFQIDGGGLATGVFGNVTTIDGGKSFKLEDILTVQDGQTLLVNGNFSGFAAYGGFWNPTWFSTLDVGGIAVEGSGAIDFAAGSIGLNRQGLVIGPDGLFQDPDDGLGNPNILGNLTLDGTRGIAVTDGGPSLDSSESGLTIIRAGATLTIDGGSFFTQRLGKEIAPDSGVLIDLTGLTQVESETDVEFRNGSDVVEYILTKVAGDYVLEDVINGITYEQDLALEFDELGQFAGISVGGSTAGDGKIAHNSGFFGIGTDLLFTGDARSTISQDANHVIGVNQELFSLSTIRIGSEFSALDQVSLTLDGGSLTGSAIRVGPGGSLVFDRGVLNLMDNYTDDSNWVVGAVDEFDEGSFQGAPYPLSALDSHLGDSMNLLGSSPGDVYLAGEVTVDTENLTLLDGSLLTIDGGGSLTVRHEVRGGIGDARIELARGSLTILEAPVEVGQGGILGSPVVIGVDSNLTVNNLTLKADGNITVDGGYLSSINFQSEANAQIDFLSGYIYLGPGVTFGPPDEANHPFGNSLELDPFRSLAITGPSLLKDGSDVSLTGGLFDPSGGLNIAAGASLTWTGGTLGSQSNRFTFDNSGLLSIYLTQPGESRELNANINNSGSFSINGIQGSTLIFPGPITNSSMWKVGVPAGQSATVLYYDTFRLTGSGSYQSDPATHEFTDLIIEDQARIQGVSGDRFVVSGDFQNTSPADWSVSDAELIFNSGPHQVSGLTNPNQAFGTITLQSGATLTGNLTAYDTLNVGTDVGIEGDLAVEGLMNLEIGNQATMLTINGNFSLNGPLNLFLSSSFAFAPNQSIQILGLNGSPYDFTGKTVNYPTDVSTFDFANGTLLITVPEPSTSMLAAMAIILGVTRRRRR
jgi:hypothetical protein